MTLKLPIETGWQFKEATKDDEAYLPVSRFPTNVHLDLLAHDLIPDPHMGKNELEIKWVGETDWVYRTTFTCPDDAPPESKTVLVFEGLDTCATVELNGKRILKSDNMFTPYRVEVTNLVNTGSNNELVITFESASRQGWKRIGEHPDHKYICWNGDNSRLAIRKAQYHWGWDWGPAYITCGPWKPITLERYTSRISDFWVETDISQSLKAAVITAKTTLEGSAFKLRFDLCHHSTNEIIKTCTLDVDQTANEQRATFQLNHPKLWWPAHIGERKQNMYTIKATIFDKDGDALDSISKKIGLRKIELVQDELSNEPGKSFFFRINNCPVFCGGSNWIPADNFIPRITDEIYRDWIETAVQGNQNMIRVWGGGIYEQQAFYEACDEFGLLVWQDFMFGCGNYPCWPELLDSIKVEARENVKRLRHHPSIVIWAGNNEDYQLAESSDLTYDPNDKDPMSWLETDFPARYIYEKILADICKDLMPSVPYHFGSPWGGTDTRDPTVGDIHQWNVWHGSQEKYQDWGKLIGRFVSEFGMEAFPDIKTIDAFLPDGEADLDRYSQSSTVDFHNKAAGHERRLALYLVENLRYSPEPLDYFIYCTQLMQAECLSSAYRACKRQWKGPGKEYCGGALVWQLNDVWPGTSWSIRDYYGRKKLSYYAIKREIAELSVGIARCEPQLPSDDAGISPDDQLLELEAWACNLHTRESVLADVILKAWHIETGVELYSQTIAPQCKLNPNQSTEVGKVCLPINRLDAGTIVVAACLFDDGRLLARYVDWPQPLKHIHMKRPNKLEIQVAENKDRLEIRTDVPVKGLKLICDDDKVEFDDNCIDVVPGESTTVFLNGATSETVIETQYYRGWSEN